MSSMATAPAVAPQNGPTHHDEHKRVSFGDTTKVTRIVYDDHEPTDVTESYIIRVTKNHFTSPDAPPEKVTVITEHSEVPRPISPPAQLADIKITSPALPALVKRMEHHENDNPFRPQDRLYHEVDPIVEAYKNRPFPPSPVGSPVPQGHEQAATTTTTTTVTTLSTSKGELGNGSTPQTAYEHKVVEVRQSHSTPQKQTPVHSATPLLPQPDGSAENHIVVTTVTTDGAGPPHGAAGGAGGDDDLPPPQKAELVHIESKKKKCGCCSVQ